MLRNVLIVALAVALCWPEDATYRAFRESGGAWEHLGEWERRYQIPAELLGKEGVRIIRETKIQ